MSMDWKQNLKDKMRRKLYPSDEEQRENEKKELERLDRQIALEAKRAKLARIREKKNKQRGRQLNKIFGGDNDGGKLF